MPQAERTPPENSTSFGSLYLDPYCGSNLLHTSSVSASTTETNCLRSSWLALRGCWRSGPCGCRGTGKPVVSGRDCGSLMSGKFDSSPPGPPPCMMTRGSTPKKDIKPSRIRSPTMPMPPPLAPPPLGKRRPPPPGNGEPKPPPPPSSRRSSTFSLSLSPRHRIFRPPRHLLADMPEVPVHSAWHGLAYKRKGASKTARNALWRSTIGGEAKLPNPCC